jgi:hypothetical protein
MNKLRTMLTPAKHHHTKTPRSIFAKRNGQWNTRNQVPQVEDPDGDVEALTSKLEFLFHALNLRISDVGSVDEVDEVENPKNG